MRALLRLFIVSTLCALTLACGFNVQGPVKLAPPLQLLYLQAPDPYGHLARYLSQYLRASGVTLTATPETARTTLIILADDSSQELLGVSSTQQTRQYNLRVTVRFEVINAKTGLVLIAPQDLTETRTTTVQANMVLGSSNEATINYEQMRRSIASSILTRLSAKNAEHDVISGVRP